MTWLSWICILYTLDVWKRTDFFVPFRSRRSRSFWQSRIAFSIFPLCLHEAGLSWQNGDWMQRLLLSDSGYQSSGQSKRIIRKSQSSCFYICLRIFFFDFQMGWEKSFVFFRFMCGSFFHQNARTPLWSVPWQIICICLDHIGWNISFGSYVSFT